MSLDSAYWLYEALAMVVEAHYAEFIQADLDYQKELSQWARTKIREVDQQAQNLAGADLTNYLTKQNHEIAIHYNQATKKLLAELAMQGAELSKLTFKMDPNL
jgi:dipeptidase